MAGRRLAPEERALWRRLIESVRPLEGRRKPAEPDVPAFASAPRRAAEPSVDLAPRRPSPGPGTELDGGWDRRLSRGLVLPERTIDLHGHTLASAHAALDHGLDRAIADGIRVILLITGRPPVERGEARRGVIRASVGDWLAASRHAGRIAAVRNAHPRHGGAGALYIILRRRRG